MLERDDPGLGVNGLDWQMRIRPEVIDDHLHVAEVRPAGVNIALGILKALAVGVVADLQPALRQPLHPVKALVGGAGPLPLLPIHVQLPELPLPLFHSRQSGHPDAVFVGFPAADGPAPVEHHLLAVVGGVGDGVGFRAGVLGPEQERLLHGVVPAPDKHLNRLVQLPRPF